MNASAPVFDEAGTLIAGVMAQTDVTDVVRMERALRESEERFRTLADNIDQFAWIADATGAIFWYNRRWFDYTGTTPEEMQGWGWRKVHHPDHVDRVVEKLNRCFRAGEPWEDVFPLRAADGSYRWFLSRMQPLRDADGRITRWLGTNTDVTEQREAQQALREADRRKDEFLATLAHELRNPLAPIRTSVELLRLQGPADEVVRRCRDIIDRQVSDLTRLVDDLLEASRITRGKLDLQKARVALREVLNRAVEAAEPGMTAGQHNFETALPEQDLWLTADATRLAQVFTNLLNNATRYTPPGGRIRLEAVVDDDAVRVTVRDTGIGIRPEHLPRIFEMFSQVTPALERTGGGLGIGLALARGLVELHGGTISAESPGEGRGSAFTVALPRCPAPAEPAGSSPSAEQPAAGRRILVVDDNRDAADGLVQILELMGHDVCAAYSGPEALELAERVQPDVMLLDIGLPGLNGYEVAARIRAADWGSRVILVAQTGWGQRQDKERARAAGFDHHLTKPVDPERLRELLANGHERPATGGR
jgi:PAS domain S-box-containing protein